MKCPRSSVYIVAAKPHTPGSVGGSPVDFYRVCQVHAECVIAWALQQKPSVMVEHDRTPLAICDFSDSGMRGWRL